MVVAFPVLGWWAEQAASLGFKKVDGYESRQKIFYGVAMKESDHGPEKADM